MSQKEGNYPPLLPFHDGAMLYDLGGETPLANPPSGIDANQRFSIRTRVVDSSTSDGFTISNTRAEL